MERIPKADYKNYISWADRNTSNRVYPLSIAEGIQSGEIFVDDLADTHAVFFWHYCGFGYITGEDPSEAFLEEIYERMVSGGSGMASESGSRLTGSGRRLVLITDNEVVIRYFRGKDLEPGLRAEYRCFGTKEAAVVSDRFRIERIDRDNIAGIRGRIVPSFSWESDEQFLEKGFGFVAVERDDASETVCAVAFSAAVSSDEVDIGVATREAYRGNGLAAALSARMCEEIIAIGKKPVWAHAMSNAGSMRTAMRCGFVEDRINTVFKK